MAVEIYPVDAAKTEQLIQAIKDNNYKQIEDLINQKFDHNCPSSKGVTPLFAAAYLNKKEAVTLILKAADIDTNRQVFGEETALHTAARQGFDEVVEKLLQANEIIPNITWPDGVTPLYFAAQENHEKIIHLLLDAYQKNGIAINQREQERINYSNLTRHAQALGYVVDKNGLCFGYAHMGMQAILAGEVARFDRRIELLGLIEPADLEQKIIDIKAKKESGFSPEDESIILEIPAFIQGVIVYHNIALFPQIFPKDAQLNSQDAAQAIPFLISEALEKKQGIASSLSFTGTYTLSELENYFQSLQESISDKLTYPFVLDMSSPVHHITVGYDGNNWIWIDTTKMIAQYFPIQNIKDLAKQLYDRFTVYKEPKYAILGTRTFVTGMDNTAFNKVLATWKNHPAWQAMHEISIEKKDFIDYGAGWLYLAANQGDLEAVKGLLEMGASVDQATLNGSSPLRQATQHGYLSVVKELLKYGANPLFQNDPNNTPLIVAIGSSQFKIMDAMLAVPNLDVNKPRPDGINPLAFAVFFNHASAVKRLLAADNINVNYKLMANITPIYLAVQNNFSKMVELLLTAEGIDANVTLNDGTTPLYVAAERGHIEILKSLLMHLILNGHTVEQLNQPHPTFGITMLFKAAENKHEVVVKHLLRAGFDPQTSLTYAKENNFPAVAELIEKCVHELEQEKVLENNPGRPHFSKHQFENYTSQGSKDKIDEKLAKELESLKMTPSKASDVVKSDKEEDNVSNKKPNFRG